MEGERERGRESHKKGRWVEWEEEEGQSQNMFHRVGKQLVALKTND